MIIIKILFAVGVVYLLIGGAFAREHCLHPIEPPTWKTVVHSILAWPKRFIRR